MPIETSPDLPTACERFLDDLEAWAEACIAEFADAPPLDGHDQGTFTIPWATLVEARAYEPALDFMTALRDKTKAHFDAKGLWHHGYWTTQDVHHGTEHFELFLGTLWRLDPDDPETVRQLLDAAEHVGNWVPGIPSWFDWGTGLFRSMHLGTRSLGTPTAVNLPPHLRCVSLSLLAYRMTDDGRYLGLARLHLGRWAEALLAGDQLPVGLTPEGGCYALEGEAEASYRGFAGQAPELRLDVDRAESFLASDAVNAFLSLWELTGELRFRQATERLLDVLATQLADPDAGPAADAIRTYRTRTGDHRYDRAVREAGAALDPFALAELAIEPEVARDRRPSGIGKRQDLPHWLEDGHPRRHNPILLALAAEIDSSEPLATRAVDLARAYFALARAVFPCGRRHGCSARSVSAVARGHGRNNNAGVVTAVLAPLMAAFRVP